MITCTLATARLHWIKSNYSCYSPTLIESGISASLSAIFISSMLGKIILQSSSLKPCIDPSSYRIRTHRVWDHNESTEPCATTASPLLTIDGNTLTLGLAGEANASFAGERWLGEWERSPAPSRDHEWAPAGEAAAPFCRQERPFIHGRRCVFFQSLSRGVAITPHGKYRRWTRARRLQCSQRRAYRVDRAISRDSLSDRAARCADVRRSREAPADLACEQEPRGELSAQRAARLWMWVRPCGVHARVSIREQVSTDVQ